MTTALRAGVLSVGGLMVDPNAFDGQDRVMDMHALLVGGTGLISTAITRGLVAAGHDVTCYTRGETNAAVPSSVRFVHGDRNDQEQFAEQVDALDIDAVVDMVCFGPDQAAHAIETFGGEIEQYVFCSTVDVYHRPPERNPVTEDAALKPAVSEYGADKAAAEDRFVAVDDEAFAATIIRPWSTYGEGGTLLHSLGSDTRYIHRVRSGEPIVVHGDGTSLWGPCHRDDVARAFVAAVGNPTAYGETYHVTSEECITWNQYHRRVARALNAPEPELVHVPTDQLIAAVPDRTGSLEDHFRFSTVFDNAKARQDLDFTYSTPFETGVKRTVAWLDERDRIDTDDDPEYDQLVEVWRDATDSFVERVRQ